MIHELLEVLQVVPPLEEEGLCDEEEPWGDSQLVALRLLQHVLQLFLGDVAMALDLVGVRAQIHFLLHTPTFTSNTMGYVVQRVYSFTDLFGSIIKMEKAI